MSSKTNKEQNPLNVQVGDVVELLPLEECLAMSRWLSQFPVMHQFFDGIPKTVYQLGRSGDFNIKEDRDKSPCWFSPNWIARIVSRAGEQREAEPEMSQWIEDGEKMTAPKVDPDKFGPHNYPGCSGDVFMRTSDCSHGCGCWMGESRSGGPVDPFGRCPKNPKPPEQPEPETAGPVTEHMLREIAGPPFSPLGNVRELWVEALNRHIAAAGWLPPSEIAELKDAAKGYARVVNFLIECGYSVGSGLNVSADDVLNSIAGIHYKSLDQASRPLTATPGPPELDGVPDDALFVVWMNTGDMAPRIDVKVYTAKYLINCVWAWAIMDHVGPILTPESKGGEQP